MDLSRDEQLILTTAQTVGKPNPDRLRTLVYCVTSIWFGGLAAWHIIDWVTGEERERFGLFQSVGFSVMFVCYLGMLYEHIKFQRNAFSLIQKIDRVKESAEETEQEPK